MEINHLSIYKKYVQARVAFNSYTNNFITNLESGAKSKKKIAMYNVIASWLDFIGNEVPEDVTSKAEAPRKVSFKLTALQVDIPSLLSPPIFIFIENSKGIRKKIGVTYRVTGGGEHSSSVALVTNINSNNNDLTASYNQDSKYIIISFSSGAEYSRGKIVVSDTGLITPQAPLILGGSDLVNTSLSLTTEELKNINSILDKIAIELNLIYSDKEYLNIKAPTEERDSLKTIKNLTLTAEDGSPLEV